MISNKRARGIRNKRKMIIPDIDQLIQEVQRGDSVAISIVKTILKQYYKDL